MSDQIKHECGIALLRLLKPLEYYHHKYGTPLYGVNKMYLLMEKQHNRGQDGAGLANVKFDLEPGIKYINRHRSNSSTPIKDIFVKIYSDVNQRIEGNQRLLYDPIWLKENVDFTGEVFLGHLRYGTFGNNSIEYCHPFIRQNNWQSRNLVLAGNFNLTNVDELLDILIEKGQHPYQDTDTTTILEKIGHFLDKEVETNFRNYKEQRLPNPVISQKIADALDIRKILAEASRKWDGGYVICGMMGHGDAFAMRDPSGIRPAYYYHDDEIAVVASERPAIQTAFNVPFNAVQELKPGYGLIIKKSGVITEEMCREPVERKACSFERIYFSRGTDAEIYRERKKLGELICPAVLKAMNYDVKRTVFSFIPNTAEISFYGLVEAMQNFCRTSIRQQILDAGDNLSPEALDEILSFRPQIEKVAVKDAKLRTFITQDTQRNDLVTHVYDIAYGTVSGDTDNLVVMDDSIVRGTTLRESILRILDRLSPEKIIIVSSAPQIRYPDCYGIDMAKLNDFVAFQAAIALLKDRKQQNVINEVYNLAREMEKKPATEMKNAVKKIYEPFSAEEISLKIAEMLRPSELNAAVEIVYQSIENLHMACPGNLGDWYFTGNYPTPGGNRVANRSFINYIEGRNVRAY
ncbi:MAG: class II glutamine amidotransferase [Bacteroidetes bacterium]|nr:class II glutamine amidotransferase [Bacteroidota bacterium]MBU1718309.1 class II glutamine amidotransferase [Bacteroidota bacterium]